jgi:tripeptide aminopeptidase
MNIQHTVLERFLRYVQVDTQSDPNSPTIPSTEKQKDLSRILVKELLEMGIEDAHLDEWGYVYATIPSNTDKDVPAICFCSHVDTSPDSSGTDVKPIVHRNYDGSDIVLPDDTAQIIKASEYKYLKQLIGQDIVTASGKTLLGSDDKSGVAEIMDAAHYFMTNPEVKHGTVKILFTPDEEIGRGVDKADMKKLGADFGYTLDGGKRGSFENETFSADAAVITIHGKMIHPGYAKNILENAVKIASDIVSALPKDSLSPETTSGREGFLHPTSLDSVGEKAVLKFIIRGFTDEVLAKNQATLRNIVADVMKNYPKSSADIQIIEQYRNMHDMVKKHPQISEYAIEAIRQGGMEPTVRPIRGGTDGSRLSYMGLPCPNLFAGMQAIHSKHEFVSVQDMEKSVETIIRLVKIWEEKS